MSSERLAAPFGDFAELIRAKAREQPRHAAIVEGDRTLAYQAFDTAIDRVAAELQRLGVQPRESVGICAATSIEYVVAFVACLRAGASPALV